MRIRERLSIGEIDAAWIYTATNVMFRFHDGHWQCSKNVYYGVDDGWFNCSSEPAVYEEHRFVEMLSGQDARVFADIMSKLGVE